MIHQQGKNYEKLNFNADDIQQINVKFPQLLFRKKEFWFLILFPFVFVIGLVLFYWVIVIILNHFFGPHEGYQQRLLNLFFFLPILLLIVLIIKAQNTIDYKLGYKKVGVFKVTTIIRLGKAKLLFLNGWRVFRIDEFSPIFKTVTKSQVLKIQKTATNQLLYEIEIIENKED